MVLSIEPAAITSLTGSSMLITGYSIAVERASNSKRIVSTWMLVSRFKGSQLFMFCLALKYALQTTLTGNYFSFVIGTITTFLKMA